MRRLIIAFWLLALVAIAVIPLAAHHDAAHYYDPTKPASISGPIVGLRTVNPHAVLIIDGTGPDGRTGRWAFEGIPPNAYQYRGIKGYTERLKPGTRITITGWPANDPQARAFWGKHDHVCRRNDDGLRLNEAGGGPLELRNPAVPRHLYLPGRAIKAT